VGEFFLAKSNLDYLNFAIKNKISVRVVTNATVLLPEHLLALKQQSDLELQISCDGIEDMYEFMRYPGKWEKFKKNAELLITSLPKANINFNFVVQPLNVENLIPSLNELNKFKKKIRITNLLGPSNISWSILTDSEKIKINEIIQEQLNNTSYRITAQQKEFVKNLINTISKSVFDENLRSDFKNSVAKILYARNNTDLYSGILRSLIDSAGRP
ncbi:MAG: hypothetical protein ACO259_10335, partial [Bacteroidia bacterium]